MDIEVIRHLAEKDPTVGLRFAEEGKRVCLQVIRYGKVYTLYASSDGEVNPDDNTVAWEWVDVLLLNLYHRIQFRRWKIFTSMDADAAGAIILNGPHGRRLSDAIEGVLWHAVAKAYLSAVEKMP